MDTRWHYVSIDSDHDLDDVELLIAIDQDATPIAATHTTEPESDDSPEPAEGFERFWWRMLIGPGQPLDPTGLPQPLVAYGTLDDEPEQLDLQWVLGDPEPDELPDFAGECWPVSIIGKDVEAFDAFPADVQELAKAAAVATLRTLTGGIIGGCSIIVRPCRAGCTETTWATYPVNGRGGVRGTWRPVYVDGQWLNVGCGVQHGIMGCTCSGLSTVKLPPPVGRIDNVWVDGELLEASAYRHIGSDLIRLDGELWPLTQDLAQPHDAEGAFAVEYLRAWPVDGLGSLVAGTLAVEYAKAFSGQKCALPQNAIQVQRAGVTVQLDKRKASQTAAFPDGLTGIATVDAFIQRYNPNGLRQPSTVWSPDVAHALR